MATVTATTVTIIQQQFFAPLDMEGAKTPSLIHFGTAVTIIELIKNATAYKKL